MTNLIFRNRPSAPFTAAACSLFWAMLANVFCQTAELPPPKEPVLHRTASPGSWTTTLTYLPEGKKGSDPKPPPPPDPNQIKSVTVNKDGSTYCERTLFLSGQTEEKWIFKGAELRKIAGTKTIVPITASTIDNPQVDYSDYTKHDFPELGWLSRTNYKGVKTYQGKPAYYFEAISPNGHELTAFLSEAQLPLYFSDEAVVRTYTYNPAPPENLTPPEDFLEVLARYKKGVEALQRHPNPP